MYVYCTCISYFTYNLNLKLLQYNTMKGAVDCMVVGFTTTYAISAYHH